MLHLIYTSICIWTFVCYTVKCSLVYDRTNDNVYVSDYCPKFHGCEEGTHIICAYYAPDRKIDTWGRELLGVVINAKFASYAVKYINAIRSRIALGQETGAHGVKLPRGYGIPRVKWDRELALFAQVHANRSRDHFDDNNMCLTTFKFADPYQITYQQKFLYPFWVHGFDPEHSILNSSVIFNAIKHYFTNIYRLKDNITPELISGYTKGNKLDEQYLALINSKMTHVGCGVSAYKQFSAHEKIGKVFRYENVALVTCIFSHRPKNKIYNTTAPESNSGLTKCGCRLNHYEDEGGLCNVAPNELKAILCDESEYTCNPNLVVLPIITVENAPENTSATNLRTYEKNETGGSPKMQEQLLVNQFEPTENKTKEVGYIKKDVAPRRDFENVKRLTEIYINNRKNRRYHNYTKLQVTTTNGLLNYSKGNEFYTVTAKIDFNKEKIDNNYENSNTKILGLLSSLEEIVENAMSRSNRRNLIKKKIRNIFNMLFKKNGRRNSYETNDKYYSTDPSPTFISSKQIFNSNRMSQINPHYEDALNTRTDYFSRNKILDVFNRYDYINNGHKNNNIFHNDNPRHAIQTINSGLQIRPLKETVQKSIAIVPKPPEKQYDFHTPDRASSLREYLL